MSSKTTTLSRHTILAAGLDLIEEGGPQHLTMRRLAERLGVTAPAVYYHLNGREQLLDAIADQLYAEIAADVPPSGSWTERLEHVLNRWYERTARHPAAMGWAMTAYVKRPPMLRLHEAMLEVLFDAGFDDDAALHVKAALMRFCLGHLVIGDLVKPGDDPFAGVPPDDFPLYRAAGPAHARFDPDEHFRVGLRALLDGLAASPLAPNSGRRPRKSG